MEEPTPTPTPTPPMSTTETTTTTTTTITTTTTTTNSDQQPQPLSKRAQKKLAKQKRYEAKKAEKKALEKEQKRMNRERKRQEWEEKLSSMGSEEDKIKLIESRKCLRKARMEQRSLEKEQKISRLNDAKLNGQNIVVDLEFAHLMTPPELHSLVQQIMYCYASNARCTSPCHLWLTGCEGDMETELNRIPGIDKWIIEKEKRSYIQALDEQKENLVYLTADAETELDDLDLKKIYIIGGLVDRNRWKGLTLKKAQDQGIQAARLPIGTYLKMSSSQVLTVNQVVEILLKYLETRNWKTSFFQVIPQRKRCESDSEENGTEVDGLRDNEIDNSSGNQKKIKLSETDSESSDNEVENVENEDKVPRQEDGGS